MCRVGSTKWKMAGMGSNPDTRETLLTLLSLKQSQPKVDVVELTVENKGSVCQLLYVGQTGLFADS